MSSGLVTEDTVKLTSLITQSRQSIEDYCNISIVAKTITLIADLFTPADLPYPPVTGIQSVATRSGTEGSGPGTYSTATTGWNTDGDQFIPGFGGTFNPSVPFRGYFQWGPDASPYGQSPGNRYRIVYTAGYATVPEGLKLAILNELAFRYENRGNESISGISEAARVLAWPYKRLPWL